MAVGGATIELESTRIGPAFRPTDGYVRTAVICPEVEGHFVEMPLAGEALNSALAVPNGIVDSTDQVDLRHCRVQSWEATMLERSA